MSSAAMLRLLVVVFLVVAAGSVGLNALAYGAARVVRRRARAACPFDDDDEPAPWPARMLGTSGRFAAECAATVLLAITAPLVWLRPRPVAGDGPLRRPVLLLGGWLQHPATFVYLAYRLRRDGWHPLGRALPRAPRGDIQRGATLLGATIARIRAATGGGDVDVVAHGIGGLVARAHIRATGRASGVARLITLGTPHQGTATWPTAHLRPGAACVARLSADDPVPAHVEVVAIYSRDDALVAPARNAYYPGAFNIELGAVGHLSLLFSPRVYALVRENLAADAHPVSAAIARG